MTECKKENQYNSSRAKYSKSDMGTACAGAGGRIDSAVHWECILVILWKEIAL